MFSLFWIHVYSILYSDRKKTRPMWNYKQNICWNSLFKSVVSNENKILKKSIEHQTINILRVIAFFSFRFFLLAIALLPSNSLKDCSGGETHLCHIKNRCYCLLLCFICLLQPVSCCLWLLINICFDCVHHTQNQFPLI